MGCGGMSSGTRACGSWAGHYTDSMIAHHLAIPNVNHHAAGGQFSPYKMMRKTSNMTENMAYGYSSESTQQALSNDSNMTRFRWFSNIFEFLCFWMKVALALEGSIITSIQSYRACLNGRGV